MDELKQRIRSVLLAADPIGIYFADVDNQDEYDDLIDKIIPSLSRSRTERAAREAVWSAFVEAFGPQIAGDPEEYTEISQRIWRTYQESAKPLDDGGQRGRG